MAGPNNNSAKGKGNYTSTSVPAGLPNGYLKGGYFDENGVLQVDYVTTFASEIGRTLGREYPVISKNKIRDYYNTVANNYEALGRKSITLPEALVNLKELEATVSNLVNNKNGASNLFKDFITNNVRNLKTEKDVEAFFRHFRAVYCYFPTKNK